MLLATLLAAAKPVQPATPSPAPREPRVGNLAQYVTADDYPGEALRRRQQGRVAFVVGVGPDGRVTGCTVTVSSGHEALDEGTCRLARARLRFNPGRIGGRPAQMSAMPFAITWSLPGE